MKTINNNHVTPSIDTLKKHPIHNYGQQETLTGRVCDGSIREFWRKSGSCQLVFKMAVNNDCIIKDMELYVKDEQESAQLGAEREEAQLRLPRLLAAPEAPMQDGRPRNRPFKGVNEYYVPCLLPPEAAQAAGTRRLIPVRPLELTPKGLRVALLDEER